MARLLQYLTATEAGLEATTSMEPISLDSALLQARVDTDSPDAAQIEAIFIPGARSLAETKTGSAIRLAKFRQVMSAFPWSGQNGSGSYFSSPFSRQTVSAPIKIVHGLAQNITSITYIDVDGATQTLDPSLYVFTGSSDANMEVVPAFGKSWPATAAVSNAVVVDYVAGLKPSEIASKYPSVIQWILLATTWAYENRQLMSNGNKETFNEMPSSYVDTLLDPIRVVPRF